VDEGRLASLDLSGLNVALVLRYDDDEEGSPWTYVLYVDECGDEAQRDALRGIFTGEFGGDVQEHFPWAWKPSNLVAVRPAAIELDHTPGRRWLRVMDVVTLRIRGPLEPAPRITCVIPGHDRRGEELVAEELRVDEQPPLEFELGGNCAFAGSFDYRSSG
jgi:Protein of unknown function (DUF1326)